MASILRWWQGNRDEGRASVMFAYALGKAQRILHGLARIANPLPGPVFVHGAVGRINDAYRDAGVVLPFAAPVATAPADTDWSQALVLAPPSARGCRWMRRFEPYQHRLRIGLDGDARSAPAGRPGSRIRAFRSCRLAGAQ